MRVPSSRSSRLLLLCMHVSISIGSLASASNPCFITFTPGHEQQLSVPSNFGLAKTAKKFNHHPKRRVKETLSKPSCLYYGVNMDQDKMMESDLLIAVDHNDHQIPPHILPPPSKRLAHTFDTAQPRGIAHRAFSIFLFNQKNEMLLTRRAKSKITFPGVWTNTCCSHPLVGMIPDEVDDAVKDYPSYPGIKHAARRKLKHELGIDGDDVPFEDFVFLTKMHYWAADTITYGVEDTPWGEHEIDYILFIKGRCHDGTDKNKNGEPTLDVNDDEVEECEYVSLEKLKEMMSGKDTHGHGEMLWSPWFRGIMESVGFDYWEQLDEIVSEKSTSNVNGDGGSNRFQNQDITYFDPPKEHVASFNLPDHDRMTGVLLQ